MPLKTPNQGGPDRTGRSTRIQRAECGLDSPTPRMVNRIKLAIIPPGQVGRLKALHAKLWLLISGVCGESSDL